MHASDMIRKSSIPELNVHAHLNLLYDIVQITCWQGCFYITYKVMTIIDAELKQNSIHGSPFCTELLFQTLKPLYSSFNGQHCITSIYITPMHIVHSQFLRSVMFFWLTRVTYQTGILHLVEPM